MRILKVAFLLSIIVLSGCCIDCKNTAEEYDNALKKISNLEATNKNNEAWLNSQEEFYSKKEKYFSKIETQRREIESAVQQTRVCDYIVPTCPSDMTAPGRAIIAKYGTKFDTNDISELQIMKVIIIIIGFFIFGLFIYGLWFFLITPNKRDFQKAKNELDNLHRKAAKFESEAIEGSLRRKADIESTIQQLENKEIQISELIDFQNKQFEENELKSIRLTNKNSDFEKDIARLKATMDAMKGF